MPPVRADAHAGIPIPANHAPVAVLAAGSGSLPGRDAEGQIDPWPYGSAGLGHMVFIMVLHGLPHQQEAAMGKRDIQHDVFAHLVPHFEQTGIAKGHRGDRVVFPIGGQRIAMPRHRVVPIAIVVQQDPVERGAAFLFHHPPDREQLRRPFQTVSPAIPGRQAGIQHHFVVHLPRTLLPRRGLPQEGKICVGIFFCKELFPETQVGLRKPEIGKPFPPLVEQRGITKQVHAHKIRKFSACAKFFSKFRCIAIRRTAEALFAFIHLFPGPVAFLSGSIRK